MTPETKTGINCFVQALRAGIAALLVLVTANAAQAQSGYACSGLVTHPPLPAVEGKNGVFFTIHPELQAHHALGDETIVMLSDLNNALAARGTTLVLLPVPTRAQVLVNQLPAMAANLGYDADDSIAVHADMIRRLNNAGLTVADPLADLRTAARSGARPFFETDPRPTPDGARILAGAVGATLADHPDLAGVTRATYRSAEGAEVTLHSTMRVQLQRACQSELPTVTLRPYATTPVSGSTGAISGTASNNRLVLVGTEVTGTPELNLSGFLSETTGLDVLSYGVVTGGAFAAISSYMTSADFQVAPPRVLVWEVPVAASMANHGDQPLRELVAAAANSCSAPIALTRAASGNLLRADLGDLKLGANTTLALDAGGVGLPYVRFHFTDADGLTRTRSIYRHADQLLTGRFYLPLSGLNTADLSTLQIEAPAAFGAQTRLATCS